MNNLVFAIPADEKGKTQTVDTSAKNNTISMAKAAEVTGLPVIGNAFSLNAAMLGKLSNIVMTTKPLGQDATDNQPMETDCPSSSNVVEMDDAAEDETYEMLDVIETDSEEACSAEEASNHVDAKTSPVTANQAPLPRIRRVFQGVTEHLLGDITTKRSEKLMATKMLNGLPSRKIAKKSTGQIEKYRIALKPVVNKPARNQATTYSRPKAPPQLTERAKTSQSVETTNDDVVSPENSDDDLIEIIEIPERLQMDLDAAINAVKEGCTDAHIDRRETYSVRDYRCNICLEQNSNFLQMRKHLFGVHLQAYVCRDCHASFDSRPQYEIHVTIAGCKGDLNSCRRYITLIHPPVRESDIAANVLECEEKLICGYCSRRFSNILDYCGHAQRHAKIFACRLCSKEKLRTKDAMAAHLTGHIRRDPVQAIRNREVFDENSLYMSTEVLERADDVVPGQSFQAVKRFKLSRVYLNGNAK